MRLRPSAIALCAALISAFVVSVDARAQDAAAGGELRIKLDQPLTAEELGALSDALKAQDATARADAPAAAGADWHVTLRMVADGVHAAIAAIPQIPALFALLDERPPGWDADARGIELGHAMLLVIGLGLIGEALFRLAARVVDRGPNLAVAEDFIERLGRTTRRMLFDLTAIGVFAGLALIGFAIWIDPDGVARAAVLTTVVSVVVFRLHVAGATFTLAPFRPELRLFRIAKDDARRIFYGFVGFALIGGAVPGLIKLWTAAEAPDEALQAFGVVFGLVVTVYTVVFVTAMRRPVGAAILEGPHRRHAGAARRVLAARWHWIYILSAVGIYIGTILVATDAFDGSAQVSRDWVTGAVLTQNYVMVFPILVAVALLAFEDRARRAERASIDAQIGMRHGALWRVAKKLAGGGVAIVGLVAVGDAWGLAWTSGPIGRAVADVVNAAAVLLVFWLGWEVLKAYIDPHIDQDDGPMLPGEDMGGAGATRLATILPLFRRFIFIAAVAVGGLIALSNLGVNIAPLLAGAGVIGLAIGFGAQTLVRDIISGIFFLIDDAFRKGEYIETGDIRGTVERISVRSMQLRHHNGPVHTIPFGEIAHLTNYSRDWAIMKFEVRVPFEVDVEKVRKLIKKAGQEMAQDPEWAEMLIDPLKSQGVNRMDDSAFIVRCKFTAKPGKQFQLRRVAYAWVQRTFAENGIPFAPKRVIVETAGSTPSNPPPSPPSMEAMGSETSDAGPPTDVETQAERNAPAPPSAAPAATQPKPPGLATAVAAAGAAVAAEQMAGADGGGSMDSL